MLLRQLQPAGRSASVGPVAAHVRAATFAQTLCRFVNNPRIAPADLLDPLLAVARRECAAAAARVRLVVHDWSTPSFPNHTRKADRATLQGHADLGYDLHRALLVDGSDGSPLAPIGLTFRTRDEVLTTRSLPIPFADFPTAHVDPVAAALAAVTSLALPTRLVHVIDREADSLRHWRQWAPHHRLLVRTDDRRVERAGESVLLSELHPRLRSQGAFRAAGAARHRGRKSELYVAEVSVTLRESARQRVDGRRKTVPGRPLALRLVVTEVRDETGQVRASWRLLTNAPADWGTGADVARWYDFRWRIESTFELLKSAGWELESRLQATGPALLRKLLVAVGACVRVWALERRNDAAAENLKELLMRLSGRQTKRSRAVTTSGLLAGLWVWQSARTVIADTGPEAVDRLVDQFFPLDIPAKTGNKDV